VLSINKLAALSRLNRVRLAKARNSHLTDQHLQFVGRIFAPFLAIWSVLAVAIVGAIVVPLVASLVRAA
jgi:hypothetical protein